MIANYTSEMAVSKTIGIIEKMLIEIGVLAIAKEYGAQSEVVALTFGLPDGGRTLAVRLPVEIDACQKALWSEYSKGKMSYNIRKTEKDFREQAERTAWKIAHDWLRIELSRLRLRQGEAREIFMSYLWDSNKKQTLFQQWKEGGGHLQLPERTM